jgi:hypothetical protein
MNIKGFGICQNQKLMDAKIVSIEHAVLIVEQLSIL